MSTTSPPLPRLALFLSDGRKVLFPPETKTLVIGREEDRCDLVLPGKLVSSQHCSLCGSVLRDMSSSLGVTKVNGKAIKEVELHLGDVITISHHTVKVVLLGKKEPLSTPNPKTKPSLPKPEMKNRTFPKFSGEISFYELIPPKVKRKDRNPGSSKEVVARRANNEIAIVRQGEDYARIKRIVDSLVDKMAR
uniref:FHA domain-containing protein n=1 Tax=Bigelowiella natans TaxID=227086 RepID=A0A6T9YGL6_BIGNA|mmetsp:Transcript_1714/g.2568  ORF Transcript_1714/g.2568 Transcript_1714/m.2568 type:complete len:192 (+) Transcript_1714:141-716(+)